MKMLPERRRILKTIKQLSRFELAEEEPETLKTEIKRCIKQFDCQRSRNASHRNERKSFQRILKPSKAVFKGSGI